MKQGISGTPEMRTAIRALLDYGKKKGEEHLHIFEVPEDWAIGVEVCAIDTQRRVAWALAVMPGPESGVLPKKDGTWVQVNGGMEYGNPLQRCRAAMSQLRRCLATWATTGEDDGSWTIPVGSCVIFPLSSASVFPRENNGSLSLEFSDKTLFEEDLAEADHGELSDVINSVCDTDMLQSEVPSPQQISALILHLGALPIWDPSQARRLRTLISKVENLGAELDADGGLESPQLDQEKERLADRAAGREILKELRMWALVPTMENNRVVGVWCDNGENEKGVIFEAFRSTFKKAAEREEVRYVLFPGTESQRRLLAHLFPGPEGQTGPLVNGWVFHALVNGGDEVWPVETVPGKGRSALVDLVSGFGRVLSELNKWEYDALHAAEREARPVVAEILRILLDRRPGQGGAGDIPIPWLEKLRCHVNVDSSNVPTQNALYVVPKAWLEYSLDAPRDAGVQEETSFPGENPDLEYPAGVEGADRRLLRAVTGASRGSSGVGNGADGGEVEPVDLANGVLAFPDNVIITSYRACLNQIVREKLTETEFLDYVFVAPEIATDEIKIRHKLTGIERLFRDIVPGPGKWRAQISPEVFDALRQKELAPEKPDGWQVWLEHSYRRGHWELVYTPLFAHGSMGGLLGLSSNPKVWGLREGEGRPPLTLVAPRFGAEVLRSSSPYRDAYLAAVAVRAAGFSRNRRVLLLMRNEEEAMALELALNEVDSGPWVMNSAEDVLAGNWPGAAKDSRGTLVVSTEAAIPRWIRETIRKGPSEKLFDLVLLETNPFDWGSAMGAPSVSDSFLDGSIDPLADDENETEKTISVDSMCEIVPGSSEQKDQRFNHVLEQCRSRLESLRYVGVLLSEEGLHILDQRLDPKVMGSLAPNLKSRTIRRLPHFPDADEWRNRLTVNLAQLVSEQADSTFPPEEAWDSLVSSMVGEKMSLHDWQQDFVKKIVESDEPPIAIERETGGGKSLVFQFPAIVRSLSTGRLTIVISPLKALMHEQAGKFMDWGFGSIVQALSGDVTRGTIFEAYRKIRDGELSMIFVAPERFRTQRFRDTLEERLSKDNGAAFWVFDEAHCISQWGQEFRPDYLYCAKEVVRMRRPLSHPGKILLVSATLPSHVIEHLETEVFADEN